MKSGSLNFLELSGPLQACNGTDFTYIQYIPQSCRKKKAVSYQPHSNNIHQLYNSLLALFDGKHNGEESPEDNADVVFLRG